MPLLTLQSVSKSYGTSGQAVMPLDLKVQDGEFLSLVGPSGCGKSTLLRMIAGLSDPSGGSIRWDGQRPRLGFVFQDPTLMPWATVLQNVRLGPELLGEDTPGTIQARAVDALKLVGLSDAANAVPRELSGGMRMRVSLARALAARPKVLLMDEPFAALDEFTRERLNDELLQLWQSQGLTILFVTHSVYESVFLSTRIAVMSPRPGRILEDIPLTRPAGRSPAFRKDPAYHAQCAQVSMVLEAGLRERPPHA